MIFWYRFIHIFGLHGPVRWERYFLGTGARRCNTCGAYQKYFSVDMGIDAFLGWRRKARR